MTTEALFLGHGLKEIERGVQWALTVVPTWARTPLFDSGLTEALTNALVHGVLELGSDGRKEGVERYLSEAETRSSAPISSRRLVELQLTPSATQLLVHIRWNGSPCPPEQRAPKTVDPLEGSGLGDGIIRAVFEEVEWGVDGCSLELVLRKP